MISVKEAKLLVEQTTTPLSPSLLPLTDAANLILAKDVFSRLNIPGFEQSSMDGYAFCYDDWQKSNQLTIDDEIPAGRTDKVKLGINKAIRIFTGAPIPKSADTVVMQEKAIIEKSNLIIEDPQLQKGSNVRLKGSEILKDVLALTKGTLLSPGAIGFLATIGEDKVLVYPAPKVSIIVTGKEIQQPGSTLQHGQVYECNSFALMAALQQLNIKDIAIEHADDEPETIKQMINQHLQFADVLLLTGGVSVGDYDFVTQALKECGVEQIFHKIKQKPGKPLFFGKKENKLVFGLPGNPSSVLTCYYEYVISALEKMMQKTTSSLVVKHLPLTKSFSKKAGLTHFLKAVCSPEAVTILSAQESYKLSSFAQANCLICMPEEKEDFEKNELVEVHILPS